MAAATPASPLCKRICVAVDGSKSAQHAFEVALAITGANNHLTVLHMADATKGAPVAIAA
jgi:nucleotide-binding universal stress UspA family protein